jgi:YidC/Oxa1 family membrane protein insertase
MDALFRFTSNFGILNIGLCIILFTLVVKLIMFPLTVQQQKSSKLMAVMQPELQAIQNKYKGKTDNDSMMRMNVETKAVYEKYGTSMTGGCLQLVIQMPILFALYRVIYNIPAYVSSVKMYFMQVVFAITGASDAGSLAAGSGDKLLQFAEAQSVNLKGINAIGDLTGVSGEALANKMVDILYKLNPAQWAELAKTFPNASSVITDNYQAIEHMNSFLGVNLASTPWQGFTPNLAWIIPILAGLSQWYSAKLMMANQPSAANGNDTNSQMMKQMNVMMPLMSLFFCFTFPAAIGIYWVASSVLQTIQQMAVNQHLKHIDIDKMIEKNLEKANKKRAKQGLPPQKISHHASEDLKNMEIQAEKEEKKLQDKIKLAEKQSKESSEYYNKNAKPGSLASKANMVAMYNEKHNNK